MAYALGHPLRTRIAAVLEKRWMDPPELAEALDEPLPRVVYHYGVLEAAGGLARVGDAGSSRR